MKNSEIFLNIAQINTTFAEVPNQISLSIYAQGCAKRCPGCQNPDLQSFSGGSKIFLNDIENILDEYDMCDWIVYLGGDIVYQPNVAEFNKEFKKHDKKICIYTGKEFEELDKEILQDVDLVKGGEWKEELGPATESGSNQSFWLKKEGIWSLIKNWDLLKIILSEQVSQNKVLQTI